MNDRDRLQFKDRQSYVTQKLGTEGWLTVYEHTDTEEEGTYYHCALARPDAIGRCLDDKSWDLLIGHGMPGFVFYPDDRTEYLRFGDDQGIEPFVFKRSFHAMKPSYLEVSEEFRHFHNLYEDKRSGTFTALDGNGDDVDVVRITAEKVQVRAKHLKEYLAARGVHMLIFFEYDRWSPRTVDEFGLSKEDEKICESDLSYGRWVDMLPGMSNPARTTFARMTGKKVVRGSSSYKPSMLGDQERRNYEEFIIGVDEDGDEMRYTCNEENLANYFGKNPEAPHYLTAVFFRKAVMSKYYNEPSKYRVEDGILFCGGYWSLRLDNNHSDYVTVFLGDLGHLSHGEQLYWKSFNVVPDGSISNVAFRRGFLGEWTDADEPALAFKAAYEQFRDIWRSVFGWDLFKPLRPDDEHHWQALHVPVGENQKEFDDQVMALSKVLVERLNEREIAKNIAAAKEDKGITKFAKYLDVIKLASSTRQCINRFAIVAGD